MATVSHPRPGFTGDTVIGGVALSFVDGTATVDVLSKRDRVYLMAHGLKVNDAAHTKATRKPSGKLSGAKANVSSVQPLDGKDADGKDIKQP